MDLQVIVFIVVAFVLGCVVAWFIAQRKGRQDAEQTKFNFEKQVSALKEQYFQLQAEAQQKEKVLTNKIVETEQTVKAQYDRLLQQINEENSRLDSALKLATDGKIEESVKAQLTEAKKSASRAMELDNELHNLRLEHDSLLRESEPLRQDLEATKSECSKLLKKIQKLEDEIEEAEEEQESLEKKLKSKSTELREVNEQLENSSRENKKLQSELEHRENELENRLDELKRKSGSIEFIQAILSAQEPENGAQDVNELYRAIDFFESFLKGQFLDCNAFLYESYPALGFNDISGKAGFIEKKRHFLQLFEEWASVKRKSWLDKKTTIAFVGEFSAGKTSIVNRILSQDNPKVPLLPVSTKATTAIPTYIAKGMANENATYRFVTPNDKLKEINEEIFKKVSKEVLDEIKGVSSLIKYFVMTYPNPNLEGLSILDTPGFNSNDAEDKARTIDVINECDALFWVFDVNAGTVNRSSIDLIKEKLNKPLIVVINKVDTKPKSEVDKVEALIRKTLTEAELNVEEFVRFSSKAPLEDIMNPIHSIPHDESRDRFISIVEQDLLQLRDILNNKVKDANRKYQNNVNKSQNITDQFVAYLNNLQNSCETVRNIPNFVSGTKVFGMELTSDRYEMSCSEANNMKTQLDKISDIMCRNISRTYDKHTDCISEVQQSYSDLVDLKASWQKIDDCLKEFKKTTKQLR